MASRHGATSRRPSVGAIAEKTFVSLDEGTLVAVAAKTLYETEGCSIIVTRIEQGEKTRRPIGIVTERDIIYRVVAQNKGSFKVTLGEIMSSPLIIINKDASLDEALSVMKRQRINRLPVTNSAGALVGLLSMQKLVAKVNIKTTFEA
jgi:CBS domain-containing protein